MATLLKRVATIGNDNCSKGSVCKSTSTVESSEVGVCSHRLCSARWWRRIRKSAYLSSGFIMILTVHGRAHHTWQYDNVRNGAQGMIGLGSYRGEFEFRDKILEEGEYPSPPPASVPAHLLRLLDGRFTATHICCSVPRINACIRN